jgi:hypothetical protein
MFDYDSQYTVRAVCIAFLISREETSHFFPFELKAADSLVCRSVNVQKTDLRTVSFRFP